MHLKEKSLTVQQKYLKKVKTNFTKQESQDKA